MANIDLTKYGITGTTEIVHNPSFEMLFEEETNPNLEGFDKGQVSELGAVNVMTGIYTGRSPKDKYIVMDENSKDTVWWTTEEYPNDNHPASQEAWDAVKKIAQEELSGKRLFVVDAFCGTNKDTRMAIRLEQWNAAYGKTAEAWFDALADFDAYASLGAFAFNHPDYVYPEIADRYFQMEGKALGHPLLHRDVCVRNDIDIRRSPSFLIVTGANMAGKSSSAASLEPLGW